MQRSLFYAALRRRDSGVFGTSLSQAQVTGAEAILDACIRHKVTDPHHVANILAQVYHETGGWMSPVRETFAASDKQAIQRLEAAWKAGKLPRVKTPYWREGWFGRGPIQITHKANYEKIGRRLGVNLAGNPGLALEPKIGADIAVVGMVEGMFTGRKLSDYRFPQALDALPDANPRRIVNGKDGTDAKVARYHHAFHKALVEAGYSANAASQTPAKPIPAPTAPEKPSAAPEQPVAEEKLSHSKRFWTWLSTGGGTAALPFVDWRVQFLIVLVVVGFAIYAIATMPAVRKKLGLS